jgi:hypothetical protein
MDIGTMTATPVTTITLYASILVISPATPQP